MYVRLQVKVGLVESNKRLYNMSEYIGKKFGEWEVLGHSHFDSFTEYWDIQCSCGYKTKRQASYVLSGKSNSCKPCAMKAFRTGREEPCLNCGSIVYKSPAQLDRSKYGNNFCSRQCSREYYSKQVQENLNSICEYCGEPFHSPPSTIRRFCSRECWKLGIKSNGPVFYRTFKKEVCERCNFVPEDKCQLDVHHEDGDKKNNEEDNLKTLCANCHRLVHRIEFLSKGDESNGEASKERASELDSSSSG